MTENLADMLKAGTDSDPLVFPENDLDIPEETEGVEPASAEDSGTRAEEQTQGVPSIPIISLGDWFEANGAFFVNSIKKVGLQVTGVDPKEDLVLTVPHESGEILEDKTPKRRLVKIDDANILPVLNLAGIDMQVYANGFRIINQYSDDIAMKCYGVKTGLIVVFCKVVEGQLVPYAKTKVKKKATDVEIPTLEIDYATKVGQPLDKETLVLLYKQASGDIDNLNSNLDAIKYLTIKQNDIRDINHHIQIDTALIELMKR